MRPTTLFWLLASAALPFSSLAQQQPPQAVNQQDEVVAINLPPGAGENEVLEILRSGDKFETNKYETRAFEIFNTKAYEMKQLVQDAVAAEKGRVRGVETRPSDGSARRYFLVVTTTPAQMPSIEETIRTVDVPGFVSSQGRSRVALRLRYRLASDMARILEQTRLSSIGEVFADDLTNTLYFDDSEYVTAQTMAYVEFYDVPVPQIEFDVQIVEVREDNASKIGLDWDAWKRGVGGQFVLTGNTFEGNETFARLDTLLTLDANVLANFLNYTIQTGNARLVQRSRLNASNLEPAVISDIKRVPFYTYERSERTPSVLTESNSRVGAAKEYDDDLAEPADRTVTIVPPVFNRLADLSPQEEGLLISIQPVIGTETVTAQIDIALNTVTGFDQQDRPIVTEQDLTNRFTLHNQKQILLGTLERETSTDSRRGIPGLRDLPVAKYLFSVETTRKDRSRLFILATPTFSNVAFKARSLEDLKASVPTLDVQERTVSIEDGFEKP